MDRQRYFKSIQRSLFNYADVIESSNSLNLNDETVHAENVFAEILNIIYKWKLQNANASVSNQSSYDLVDRELGIYIQITSDKNYTRKIKDSVSSFRKTDSASKYGRFIIFFIKKKASKAGLHEKDGLSYEVWDLPKVLKDVMHTDSAALVELDRLMSNFTSRDEVNSNLPEQQLPLQKKRQFTTSVLIERPLLLNELFAFSQEDNGLLVGGAGYGKSFCLNNLLERYNVLGLPCHIIYIDDILTGTDGEIAGELGSSTDDWLKALMLKASEGNKGLLIFDGYDTAKSEVLKGAFIKHIRKAIDYLSGKMNVIVSVRNYEGAHSIPLQELFPRASAKNDIQCRNFEIHELDDTELAIAQLSSPLIGQIFDSANPSLYKLLKVPYFLKIAADIFLELKEGEAFSDITSESQLLNAFWRKRIADNATKELFVDKLCRLLADSQGLSIDRHSIINDSTIGISEDLLSLGILSKGKVRKSTIAFSHNILLDYAISRYLLFEKYEEQLQLLKHKQRLPFLFRQAFIYFYNELWDSDKKKFWEHYWNFRRIDDPSFRIFHLTVLDYTLITRYESIEETDPLFQKETYNSPDAILKALRTMRFVNKSSVRSQDVLLLEKISRIPEPQQLWEVGNMLDRAIKVFSGAGNKQVLALIAKAAVQYMRYSLEERNKSGYKAFIDSNASNWGLRNLLNIYEFDRENIKPLIDEILGLLAEEDCNTYYFFTLSNQIATLYRSDPSLAVMVYKKIYLHIENSTEKTAMVRSAVISLIGNRRQDFSHNRWQLEKEYHKLLEIDFMRAAELGIDLVNEVGKVDFLPGESLKVIVGDIEGVIEHDIIVYDEKEEGIYVHVHELFRALESRKLSKPFLGEITDDLYSIISRIRAGTLWRKVLKFISDNILYFKRLSYQLLCNPSIFLSDETLHEAGVLLSKRWPSLTSNQRRKLERLILKLEKDEIPFYNESRISRLIGCVAALGLETDEAKSYYTGHTKVENNKIAQGPVAMANFIPLSEEEKMIDVGIDVSKNTDRDFFLDIEGLQLFCDRNKKKEATSSEKEDQREDSLEDYKMYLPFVRKLFEKSIDGTYQEARLKFNCEHLTAKYAGVLSSYGNSLQTAESLLVKEIAMRFINAGEYKSDKYDSGKFSGQFGSPYSPDARNASVLTLRNYMYTYEDPDVEDKMFELMYDNTVIVRLESLKSLEYFWHRRKSEFWKIILERLIDEKDGLCYRTLISALCYNNIIEADNEKVEEACDTIFARLNEDAYSESDEIVKVLSVLMLKRIIYHDAEKSLTRLYTQLHTRKLQRSLIFDIRTYLNALRGKDYINKINDSNVVFKLLYAIVEISFDWLNKDRNEEQQGKHLEIVDLVIQNIFFAIDDDNGQNREKSILQFDQKLVLFSYLQPLFEFVLLKFSDLGAGYMQGHTAYYFMQALNELIEIDPGNILRMAKSVVYLSSEDFQYDTITIQEVLKIIEKIISIYPETLNTDNSFADVLFMLDLFTSAGSEESMEMTWRLNEAFH